MEKEKIGKYIKKKRTEAGMTQQQLADKIQVTEKAVSRWETGRGIPDISLLEPLARELHVSITELLCGADSDTAEKENAKRNSAIVERESTKRDSEIAEEKKVKMDAAGEKEIQDPMHTDLKNVIEYVQENRKDKYNVAFKISVLCFAISFVLFLLYLREAYRFQGNYFGTLVRMISVFAFFLLGETVLNRFYLERIEEKRKWKKISLSVLMGYYMVMLFNLTFLERTQTVNEYNLIPFRTIGSVLVDGDWYAILINICGNFLIFMPLEFFLIELFGVKSVKKNLLVCIMITVGIESLQYIFKVGMFDVDDMILSVAGMMVFYFLYKKVILTDNKGSDELYKMQGHGRKKDSSGMENKEKV